MVVKPTGWLPRMGSLVCDGFRRGSGDPASWKSGFSGSGGGSYRTALHGGSFPLLLYRGHTIVPMKAAQDYNGARTACGRIPAGMRLSPIRGR